MAANDRKPEESGKGENAFFFVELMCQREEWKSEGNAPTCKLCLEKGEVININGPQGTLLVCAGCIYVMALVAQDAVDSANRELEAARRRKRMNDLDLI
jgi:hypothetical protein